MAVPGWILIVAAAVLVLIVVVFIIKKLFKLALIAGVIAGGVWAGLFLWDRFGSGGG